ncbi:unnamed protein product [Pieris macdunnoughi]|uniref:Uncharacterized protein n=1 Tax=Pieris macdunnoughi TaxID=345717 RepID=A0A821UL45_9NEOP|nr:unnamed protein product [Pieris macdunnoughi]
MGSRARMLVKLCEQDSGSIEDQSSSNSFNSASVNEIHTADQTALTVTENIISSLNNTNSRPILANDENGSEGETKDFSAEDSGDEYKPEQSVKRGRINSTSSTSSTSSSCSTSSSSSSDSTSSSTSTSTTHDSVRNSNLMDASQEVALPAETTVPKKGKKRVRNESAWIKNVRKQY